MSNILVTGSEGHLMQSVIPKLLDAGHTVIGIDNLSRHKSKGNINSSRYSFIKMDASGKEVEDVFKYHNIEYVIQAAATIFGVGGFNKYCADILSTDLKIQTNMLELSRSHGIKRFIYISSSMVYETCVQKEEGNGEFEPFDSFVPQTDYGLSKLTGERLVLAYNKQYGLDYLIWRPFNILNPAEIRESYQGYSHVYADFIDELIGEKVETLNLIGTGNQVRCFTWIEDVSHIIANNLNPENHNKTFNIGNVQPVTMKELAEKIHRIGVRMGMRVDIPLRFNTAKSFSDDVQYRVPFMGRFTRVFGEHKFKPLDESLEECINYYIRAKVKW